jgi:hypothetical protein
VNINYFPKRVSFVLGLAALVLIGNGLSAQAQTVDTGLNEQLAEPVITEASPQQLSSEVDTSQNLPTQTTVADVPTSEVDVAPEGTLGQPLEVNVAPEEALAQPLQALEPTATPQTANALVAPVPGTTATSSAALAPQTTQTQFQRSDVAQADIDVGQPTRGISSYIGIAANIGLGGESALGDGNFMVISKIGVTNTISARPSVVLGDDTVFLIPVTYDFARQIAEPFEETFPVVPYAGAGIAIEASDDAEIALMLTGGVDVPITTQLTATAAVNAAFFDDTDIGLMIGVGYNFGGLFGR